MIKKYFLPLLFIFLFIIFGGSSLFAENRDGSPSNVILVKFKDAVSPVEIIEQQEISVVHLKRLHTIKPAVTRFLKSYSLTQDAQGKYIIDEQSYQRINDIPEEKIFSLAYQKMPENERSAYRVYRLELPLESDVQAVLERLNADPNIEYAELDQKMTIERY